jgi:hypothetical protein
MFSFFLEDELGGGHGERVDVKGMAVVKSACMGDDESATKHSLMDNWEVVMTISNKSNVRRRKVVVMFRRGGFRCFLFCDGSTGRRVERNGYL